MIHFFIIINYGLSLINIITLINHHNNADCHCMKFNNNTMWSNANNANNDEEDHSDIEIGVVDENNENNANNEVKEVKDEKDMIIDDLKYKIKTQEKYNKKLIRNREEMVDMYEKLLNTVTRKYQLEKKKTKEQAKELKKYRAQHEEVAPSESKDLLLKNQDVDELDELNEFSEGEESDAFSDIEPPPDPYAEVKKKYAEFEQKQLEDLPDYMKPVYSNSLLLNFQIVGWYRTEKPYIAAFRVVFAFMFYSVPLTIISILKWAGAVDEDSGPILELLVVSFYTGPVVSRAVSEVTGLRDFLPIKDLLVMQMDVGAIFLLYGASTGGKEGSDDSGLVALLTGFVMAIIAFVGFVYCLYKDYLVYAFGYIELYYDLPSTLLVEDLSQNLSLKERLAILRADIKSKAELGIKGATMVAKGATMVGGAAVKGVKKVGSMTNLTEKQNDKEKEDQTSK